MESGGSIFIDQILSSMYDSSEGNGNVAPEDVVEETGSAGSGLFAVSPKLVDFAVTPGGRSQQ